MRGTRFEFALACRGAVAKSGRASPIAYQSSCDKGTHLLHFRTCTPPWLWVASRRLSSCKVAEVECRVLLQSSYREGNRRENLAQTERAANGTKAVAHRSASEEALLDEDYSDRHEDTRLRCSHRGCCGFF